MSKWHHFRTIMGTKTSKTKENNTQITKLIVSKTSQNCELGAQTIIHLYMSSQIMTTSYICLYGLKQGVLDYHLHSIEIFLRR